MSRLRPRSGGPRMRYIAITAAAGLPLAVALILGLAALLLMLAVARPRRPRGKKQEYPPWHELAERRLDLPREQPGVRGVVIAAALLITIAASLLGLGRQLPQTLLLVRTPDGVPGLPRRPQCSSSEWSARLQRGRW